MHNLTHSTNLTHSNNSNKFNNLSSPSDAIYQYTKNIGILAYIYGYAPVVFQALMSYDLIYRAPMNTMYFYKALTTPTVQPFYAPNSDDLYATAWIDLTNTPVLITTPNTIKQNRWYTIQLLSIYSDTFANLPGLNKNQPSKKYILVGPGKSINNNIFIDAEIISAPTNIVYLVSRVAVKDTRDLILASYIQHQITVTELVSHAPVLSIDLIPETIYTDLNFFNVMLDVMNYNGYFTSEIALVDQFKTIGLNPNVKFDPNSSTPIVRLALIDAIEIAIKQIISYGYLYLNNLMSSTNWMSGTNIGTYDNKYLIRSFVSYIGPGANVPTEELYMSTTDDINGKQLNGLNNKYLMHFSANSYPKVNSKWGFWSITLYVENKKSQSPGYNLQLYPNQQNKYTINSSTNDLVYNSDGLLDIYIQNDPPKNFNLINWLPAPNGPFQLVIRIYAATLQQINDLSNIPSVVPI